MFLTCLGVNFKKFPNSTPRQIFTTIISATNHFILKRKYCQVPKLYIDSHTEGWDTHCLTTIRII